MKKRTGFWARRCSESSASLRKRAHRSLADEARQEDTSTQYIEYHVNPIVSFEQVAEQSRDNLRHAAIPLIKLTTEPDKHRIHLALLPTCREKAKQFLTPRDNGEKVPRRGG